MPVATPRRGWPTARHDCELPSKNPAATDLPSLGDVEYAQAHRLLRWVSPWRGVTASATGNPWRDGRRGHDRAPEGARRRPRRPRHRRHDALHGGLPGLHYPHSLGQGSGRAKASTARHAAASPLRCCAPSAIATSSPCTRAPGRDRPLNTPDRQTLSDVARARGLSRAAAALPSQAEPRRLRGRIPHGLQFLFFRPARARSDPSRGAFY